MFYKKAFEESERLKKQICTIQSQLQKLPDGKLYCVRDGKRYKWFHRIDGEEKYLTKKDLQLAESLAKKRYLIALEKDLTREKRAIDFYLRHHTPRPWGSEQLTTNNSEVQKLLKSYFKPKSQKQFEWANSTFKQNQDHPEHLIYKIPNGNYVRSKSEALIAMVLHNNKIPFRYECALQLGDTTVFPDFTIIHPETGKIYYFEHFGMIDNPVYRQKTLNKLDLYISNGIIPSVNLITTCETKDYPLDIEQVEKIVKDFFLS